MRRGGEIKQLNILIPQSLKIKAKIKAIKEGKSLGAVVRELLREYCEEKEEDKHG